MRIFGGACRTYIHPRYGIDHLVITETGIRIVPVLRRAEDIEATRLAAIELHRTPAAAMPQSHGLRFVAQSMGVFLRFRLVDGYARRMFVPWRPWLAVEAAERYGWPVEETRVVPLRDVLLLRYPPDPPSAGR